MKLETIVVGAFEVNCFVVYNDETRKALIIDPGAEGERITETVLKLKLTVTHCIATHGHMDHISAMSNIVKELNIQNVLMHKEDEKWAFSEENAMLPFYPKPQKPQVPISFLEDGTELDLYGLKIFVIHTPGHTPGSISLYMPENKTIFTGDTLFKDGVGRTDLPGGNAKILGNSLKKLSKLPPETKVFPGHGETTTIKEELGGLSLWN